jgi:hypothetical protein
MALAIASTAGVRRCMRVVIAPDPYLPITSPFAARRISVVDDDQMFQRGCCRARPHLVPLEMIATLECGGSIGHVHGGHPNARRG